MTEPLAVAVGLFATVSGLDRDRAFSPTVAIVVASYYSLFAAMAGATRALVPESPVGVVFLSVAVLGFRSSLWLAAIALGAHGVFDLAHAAVITNPGVPSWWPACFCRNPANARKVMGSTQPTHCGACGVTRSPGLAR